MLEVMMVDDGAVRGRLRFDTDRIRRLTAVEPRTICVHQASHTERQRVELYLEDAYARAFDGRIEHHYPNLMSVQDQHGEIHAAVGFRFAANEPLYLEQYLDEPVEVAVSRQLGTPADRGRIAEIGNLASRSQGASLFLFLALASHLNRQGCVHAAATATRQLRRSFARVGFPIQSLARADAARLKEGGRQWGAYYARDPEVLVGDVGRALPALCQMLLAEPRAIGEAWPRRARTLREGAAS